MDITPDTHPCPNCEGYGKPLVRVEADELPDPVPDCSVCNGTGIDPRAAGDALR